MPAQLIEGSDGWLREAWNAVFAGRDPFVDSLQQDLKRCGLFFPTDGYHLTDEQFRAVMSAARAVGDSQFVVSEVEYAGDFFRRGRHWLCPVDEFASYVELPLVLENAVYSPAGKWGLLVSHEQHAIVGGVGSFCRAAKYEGWERDRAALLSAWARSEARGWIEPLMSRYRP